MEESIQSAIGQDKNISRVVVLFGGGGGREIVEKYLDQGVGLVDTSLTPGMANNWNYAIQLAETEYFSILHQDDLLSPEYARKMMEFIENIHDVSCAMVYCDNFTVNESGRSMLYFSDHIKRMFRHSKIDLQNDFKVLLKVPFITCPTILYKTSSARSVGLFNKSYKDALDWEYQIRTILKGFSIHYLPLKLYSYRRHTKNESVKNCKNLCRYHEIIDVYNGLFLGAGEVMSKLKISAGELRFAVYFLLLKDGVSDLIRLRSSGLSKFALLCNFLCHKRGK